MNDLRHDQEAADERTHYNLRTVKMPDLRSPDCRTLDAQARDLRTAGDKIAELQQRLASVEDRLAALEARPLAMAEDAWGVG